MKKLFKLSLAVLALVGMTAALAMAADLTTTAAAGQAGLAGALPFLTLLSTMPLTAVGIAAAFLSLIGFAMEHNLENFVMDKISNDTIKKLLPMAGGLVVAVLTQLSTGLPWTAALGAGLTSYVAAIAKHDSPMAAQSATAAALVSKS